VKSVSKGESPPEMVMARGTTNLHMEELLGDDASLVVQGIEFLPVPSIVVMGWPVL